MATEKQIAAKSHNAKRSTGPRTALGKMTSSRNAYRHRLSCSVRAEMTASVRIDLAVIDTQKLRRFGGGGPP
jgi:hypothetical protein